MEIGSGREDCMSMGMTSEVLTAVKIQIEDFRVSCRNLSRRNKPEEFDLNRCLISD